MLSQLEVSGSHITDAFLGCHGADQLAAPQDVVLHLQEESGQDESTEFQGLQNYYKKIQIQFNFILFICSFFVDQKWHRNLPQDEVQFL